MPSLLTEAQLAGLGALELRAARVEAITFTRENQQRGADDPIGPQTLVVSLRPGRAPRISSDGAVQAPADGRLMTALGEATFLPATGDHFILDGKPATIGRVQTLPDYRVVAEFTFDSWVP